MTRMCILIFLMILTIILFSLSFGAFNSKTVSGNIGKTICLMQTSGTLTVICVLVGVVLDNIVALQTRRASRKRSSYYHTSQVRTSASTKGHIANIMSKEHANESRVSS